MTYVEWYNEVDRIFRETHDYHTWKQDYDNEMALSCFGCGDSPEEYVEMEVSYWHD